MRLIINKISLTARVGVFALAVLMSLAAAAQGIDKPVRRAPLSLQGYDFHYATDGVPYIMTDNLNEEKTIPSYLVVTLGNEVDYKYQEI